MDVVLATAVPPVLAIQLAGVNSSAPISGVVTFLDCTSISNVIPTICVACPSSDEAGKALRR